MSLVKHPIKLVYVSEALGMIVLPLIYKTRGDFEKLDAVLDSTVMNNVTPARFAKIEADVNKIIEDSANTSYLDAVRSAIAEDKLLLTAFAREAAWALTGGSK